MPKDPNSCLDQLQAIAVAPDDHRDIAPFTLAQFPPDYWERVTGWAFTFPMLALLHDREMEELLWRCMHVLKGTDVVNIGDGFGASPFLFAKAIEFVRSDRGDDTRLWTYDCFPGSAQKESFRVDWLHRLLGDFPFCIRVRGTSSEIPALNRPVGLAFIDGDHSSAWARRDLLALREVCVPGAVILIHDCWDSEVAEGPGAVWREVLDGKHSGLSAEETPICTTAVIHVEG